MRLQCYCQRGRKKYDFALEAIRGNYEAGKTDEFIEPCVFPVANGKTCEVMDHDAMIFFNFRADRVRQLAKKIYGRMSCQRFYLYNNDGI